MIRLTSTSHKLQAVLAGATTTNVLPIVVGYSDQTATTYLGGDQRSSSNGTSDVDILSAPAASTIRDVDFVNIYNADTVAATVTVKVDVSGTEHVLVKAVLSVADTLHYTHGTGWKVVDSTGAIKGTSAVSGIIGVANGGTGLATLTANNIMIGNGTGNVQFLAPGASGNVATSNGTAWVSSAASGAPGLVLLATASASASATIDFTSNIDSTYDEYQVHIQNMVPASAALFYMRTSTNGGSSFDSSAGNYILASARMSSSGASVTGAASTSATQIELTGGADTIINTASAGGWSGTVTIYNPASSSYQTTVTFHGAYPYSTTERLWISGHGSRQTAADVDAIRFLMSTGNITSGSFKLYGVRKV